MMTSRPGGFAALMMAAGFAVTGCQQLAAETSDTGSGDQPAVLEVAENGGPGRITLSAEAEERLGIETAPVSDGLPATIPYGSVVYDNEGASWAFVRIEERTYERAPIAILDITGDQVLLGSGPPAGTEVVTVGAAELVGVEAGISGGE